MGGTQVDVKYQDQREDNQCKRGVCVFACVCVCVCVSLCVCVCMHECVNFSHKMCEFQLNTNLHNTAVSVVLVPVVLVANMFITQIAVSVTVLVRVTVGSAHVKSY